MRSAGERAQADERPPAKPAQAAAKVSPKPTAPKAAKKPPAKRAPVIPAGLPPKVTKALKGRRTVVLFFRQPGADDDATQRAVRSLRGKKRVAVFLDGINHLGRYRRLVTGLGITQAPSVVILGKSRKATLVEGFIDEGSLTQQVLDAR